MSSKKPLPEIVRAGDLFVWGNSSTDLLLVCKFTDRNTLIVVGLDDACAYGLYSMEEEVSSHKMINYSSSERGIPIKKLFPSDPYRSLLTYLGNIRNDNA